MPMNARLLRPIASGVHPEAAAWKSAVVANGGSVSSTTLKAVAVFCKAIDDAGIRDRFYRLNLFAGTGLNAALVPLYRGPSRTGTQYGNTTDTNNGPFVSGDYVETGATGGLKGNGTSKYLNTGLKANDLAQTDRHISVVVDVVSIGTTGRHMIGMDNFGGASNAFWGILHGITKFTSSVVRAQVAAANSTQFDIAGRPQILLTGNGSASVYLNGSASITGPATAFTAPALDVYVLGLNRNGSVGDYADSRLQSYSIGAAMTSGQATSFYNATLAFQTAMSRT